MKDFNAKEFRDQNKEITVFHGLCKGCGLCVEKCHSQAIAFSKKDLGIYSTPTVEIDLKKCDACGICETVCPECALRVEKIKNA